MRVTHLLLDTQFPMSIILTSYEFLLQGFLVIDFFSWAVLSG